MAPYQSLIEYLESVVYGKRKGPAAALTRIVLSACSLLYRSAIKTYLLPFSTGIRARKRLSRPVISVGNLTIGGTGKSPTVHYLCRGLAKRGWKPAVLSYGYGGRLRGKMGIVSDRSQVRLAADIAGDEPVMLASALPGLPVIVGKHRHVTGQAAVQDLEADILVLDDGFQVWKLHRDLDIVLINAGNPFDNRRVLPAGKLREPMSALGRAHCVIATGEWDETSKHSMLDTVRRYTQSPVYFGRFEPSTLISLSDGSRSPVESLAGKIICALSSIANPASFERTLAGLGAQIIGSERFPDHHLYTHQDIVSVNRRAAERGTEAIVTTDKDAAKLKECMLALPAYSLRIGLRLDDERGFWEFVETRLRNANA